METKRTRHERQAIRKYLRSAYHAALVLNNNKTCEQTTMFLSAILVLDNPEAHKSFEEWASLHNSASIQRKSIVSLMFDWLGGDNTPYDYFRQISK